MERRAGLRRHTTCTVTRESMRSVWLQELMVLVTFQLEAGAGVQVRGWL